MCSLDHKVMMTLKLGRWRDYTVDDTMRRNRSRGSDLQTSTATRPAGRFSILLQILAARLPFSRK